MAREFSQEKWDTANEKQLAKLDELDRMSVELHRFFVRCAKSFMNNNLLNGEAMTTLRRIFEDDRELLTALNEWQACMNDIRNGNRQRVRMYENIFGNLFAMLDSSSLRAVDKENAKTQIDAIDEQFRLIRESQSFRNYKDDDVAIIRNAPFILTYTEKISLAVPYNFGGNTEIFGNIAANAVVNAQSVNFLFCLADGKSFAEAKSSLPNDLRGIFEFLRRKNLRANVKLIIAFDKNEIGDEQRQALSSVLEFCYAHKRFGGIEWLPFKKTENVPKVFSAWLKRRFKSKVIWALEKNSSKLSSMLEVGGLYKNFDCCEFDALNQQFKETSGRASLLKFIDKPTHLTVADLFRMKNANIVRQEKPEFFDSYAKLWSLYRFSPRTWKELCNLLKNSSDSEPVVASFEKRISREFAPTKFVYLVPVECRQTVDDILKELKRAGIVEPESKVVAKTTTACRVDIKTYFPSLSNEYDRLFSDPYILQKPTNIKIVPTPQNVQIKFDNLKVKNLARPQYDGIIRLLEELGKERYLTNLKINANGISFTYPTLRLKELLTVEGKLLEVFVYHKLVASGLADDISCGCEIFWSNSDANNEFDCILTKGFRTIFIECKARINLEQDFYFKLSGLAKQFGVNAKAVLIADTQEKSGSEQMQSNEMQRMRGEQLDIVTIYEKDDINKIDVILKRLLEEDDWQ